MIALVKLKQQRIRQEVPPTTGVRSPGPTSVNNGFRES